MPYTLIHRIHSTDVIGRTLRHWPDRDGAAVYLRKLAQRMVGSLSDSLADPAKGAELIRLADEAGQRGYFVLPDVETWAIAEIDRPEQPVNEFSDDARRTFAAAESARPSPARPGAGDTLTVCFCLFNHPLTEEARAEAREQIAYARSVGDMFGALLHIARMTGPCPARENR